MARRKLVEVEVPEPSTITRVMAGVRSIEVLEMEVTGTTRLLTVEVSATKPLPPMADGLLTGTMVRLRPSGLCTADDMDFAERAVRQAGALTVTRMPLAEAGPDADVAGEPVPDEELAVLPMIEALDARLRQQMDREGCSDDEREATLSLAHRMLEQAGG